MNNKYLVLVNRNNPFKDNNLFNIVNCNSLYAKDRYLEEKTYESFLKFKDFLKDYNVQIEIESGYRSLDYQQKVWDECVLEKGLEHTKKYVAKPGYSEHQTGLAVDICFYINDKFYIEHELENLDCLKLIKENAYKFGFIERYPENKEKITGYQYEPWHLRYIDDVNVAKFIKDNNLCLEEYLRI